jgi:hypothetical protein
MKYPSIFQSKHLVYQDLGYGLKVSVRKEWRGVNREGENYKDFIPFPKRRKSIARKSIWIIQPIMQTPTARRVLL